MQATPIPPRVQGKKLKCAIYTRVSTDNQAEVEFNSCGVAKGSFIFNPLIVLGL